MSEELTPMNHRELWLKAIATGTVPEWLEPMTHEELWLKAIAQGGGSGGGVLVVHEVDGALDKTYKQIVDALHANGVILEWTHEDGWIEVYLVIDYGNVNNVYLITFHTDSSQTSAGGKSHYYVAESENSYPTNDD